jgi:hypothetical protein
MATIADIARKWSKKTDMGRGLVLDADDLDILNAMGIGKQIAEAAAEFQRDQCQKRVARNQSIPGESSGSSPEPVEITKSSGTTPPESGKEALARARQSSAQPASS